MTAKTKSLAKPEGSPKRTYVGLTTKRTRGGELRWLAQATINKAHVVLGTWPTAEEAAIAFDRAVLHYRGAKAPRNFPERRDLVPADAVQLQEESHRAIQGTQENPYDGVLKADGTHWTAKLRVAGKPTSLGTWPTAEDAAVAYDRAVLKYNGKDTRRNFPELTLTPADVEQLQIEAQLARGVRAQSGYIGVTPTRKSGNGSWAASICVDGQYERLGSWLTAEKAAEAYDRAVLMYRGMKAIRNFPKRRPKPADAAQLRAEARQAHRDCNSSQYPGVVRTARGWVAMVGNNFLGCWQSEEKAAEACDRFTLFSGEEDARLNFPLRGLAPASMSVLRLEARRERRLGCDDYSSRYIGVYYDVLNDSRPWGVRLTIDGKAHCPGHWQSEKDAAIAYDRAVRFYALGRLPLNFPDEDYPPADAATLLAEAFREGKERYSSTFRGVHYEEQNQCWIATITFQMECIWLGRFADESEAAIAYDRKAIELRGQDARLNFDPRTGERVWGRRLREIEKGRSHK